MTRAWLVRAGSHGEREELALREGLAVIGWDELTDLSGHDTRESLMKSLQTAFPDASHKRLQNWQAQLWAFLRTMDVGDLVVLPLKTTSSVAIGRVTGPYDYRPDLPSDAHHTRAVEWLSPDVPRTAIGQDLLYSLGAFLTVCQVKRNNALHRLECLATTGRDPGSAEPTTPTSGTETVQDRAVPSDEEAGSVGFDVQRYAADQISACIAERFAGHGLAWLVQSIFAARGMVTWRSPEGPDG